MKEIYVIKRKFEEEEKNRIVFFYDWMFGTPCWGEESKEAMKFETKGEAKKHLPGLRHRRTVFGSHYAKGIRCIPLN